MWCEIYTLSQIITGLLHWYYGTLHSRKCSLFMREPLDPEAYQIGLNSIHSDVVAGVINHFSMNAILEAHPHSLQLKNVGCQGS